MIISDEELKLVKKDAGGLLGSVGGTYVDYCGGVYGLKENSKGQLLILKNGFSFDSLFQKKLFIPLDNVLKIYKYNNVIFIDFIEEENQYRVEFKAKNIDKIKEITDAIKRLTGDIEIEKLQSRKQLEDIPVGDEFIYSNDSEGINIKEYKEEKELPYLSLTDVEIASIIEECGYNKINSIKQINKLTNLSLTQCKKIVDDYFINNNLGNIEKYDAIKDFNNDKKHEDKIKKLQEKQLKLEMKNTKLNIKQQKNAIKQDKKTARCPKCGSTSLSAHKKGFGIGKAVVGALVTSNPIGLVAGNANAKKVRVTCLKCGKQFWA
ncbi:TPA: hypothetical protein ACG3IC_001216 [Clostridioides difficile]